MECIFENPIGKPFFCPPGDWVFTNDGISSLLDAEISSWKKKTIPQIVDQFPVAYFVMQAIYNRFPLKKYPCK